MGAHDYHEEGPGYSPNQVLHDGCSECAQRGQDVSLGIASMDARNFARAWRRAADWNMQGLPDVAENEVQLLRVLWTIQLRLESYGVPIGTLPTSGASC
jgi:hypothetical protein